MKTKIFITILVLLVLVAGVGLVIRFKKDISLPSQSTEQSGDLITLKPTMVDVSEDSYLFGISGSYPQFSQADDAFNKTIADFFTQEVTNFKSIVTADYQGRLDTGGDKFLQEFTQSDLYSFGFTTEILISNNDFISIIVRYGGYTGGAHGYQNIITFNYDVKKQTTVTITDIFPNISGVAEMARQQLRTKFLGEGISLEEINSMIMGGTDPQKIENFKNFVMIDKETTIRIYFPEYQVAPYVMGEQFVEIGIGADFSEGDL